LSGAPELAIRLVKESNRSKKLVLSGLFAAFVTTVSAQEFPHFAFDAGAGFTTPAGNSIFSLKDEPEVGGEAGGRRDSFLP